MRRIILLIPTFLVSLFFLSAVAQVADSVRALQILRKFAVSLEGAKYVSYHSVQRYVNSGVDDSVFMAEGTVWMLDKPTDSIFEKIFHVKGKNRSNDYDYYYDGQRSMEISHNDRKITVIDPYAFKNDPNNPAKTRTALRPLHPLWSGNNLFVELFTNYPYPYPAITLDSSAKQWIIILDYPQNKDGATSVMTLFIERSSGWLTSSKRVVYWNGTVHTQTYSIDRIRTGIGIADSIPLVSSYADYAVTEYKRPAMTGNTWEMTGKQAPGFRFSSFNGESVTLKQFRGKYVLLDFWESWCGYCILALPKMKELFQKYNSKGLEIIGITTENENRIRDIIQKNQLPYLHVKGDAQMLSDYHIVARPGYVLIDKEGKIIVYNDWMKIEQFLKEL